MKFKKTPILGNLIIVFLLIISITVWYRVITIYSQPEEKGLIVTFLNVGQGDSILITTPSKKNILIDGGTMPKKWSTFDAGKRVVVPSLRKKDIRKLDLVIATHPDLDHIGGLINVLKHIKVARFLDSGIISATYTYEDLLKLIEKKKIKYEIAKQEKLNIDPLITFEILSPLDRTFTDENDNSIVIKLTYGKISFLFTGDISQSAEKLYAEKYDNRLKSTVLKAAHHGSRKSSSIFFLNCVQPEIAVISCGKNNPFGHPTKEVLERLEKIGAKIYRTDQNGNVTIKTDGNLYTITTTK